MGTSREIVRYGAACLLGVLACACNGTFPVEPEAPARARQSFDEATLIDALDRIEVWHRENGTGANVELRPGATTDELERLFQGLPVRPTLELEILWGWHDGETRQQPFVWYHDLLSAEEAVREYRALLRHPLIRWDPAFIPVLSFQGEWYAVRCAKTPLEAGPVVHFFLEDTPKVSFTSLTTLAVTMAESFEQGALRWDPTIEGITDEVGAIAEIHARHNPGTTFPYWVPTDGS